MVEISSVIYLEKMKEVSTKRKIYDKLMMREKEKKVWENYVKCF